MVMTKKLTELTEKEAHKCGWIEKIAYRGDDRWTMYDFESESFNKIRLLYPMIYEELQITFGPKWFAIYRDSEHKTNLIDIAKMDIGKGQEDIKRQIQDFIRERLDTKKLIIVNAREDTSYFSFVKSAATGEIEIYADQVIDSYNRIRHLVLMKADGKTELDKQKQEYQEKLDEFMKNKDNHSRIRRENLERYIKQLEAEMGEKALKEIIDRI